MIKWVNVGSSCEYEFFADCSFFMQIIIFILATRVSLFQSSISENQVVVEIQNDQSLRQWYTHHPLKINYKWCYKIKKLFES